MEARMSRAAEQDAIIGINWASNNFRAYLIAGDGSTLDEFSAPKGVIGLDRDGMAQAVADIVARWPDATAIYASGMIGSNVGWIEVPYAEAPAGAAELRAATVKTRIGGAEMAIASGVACRRNDGAPDVLRGEEVELIGLAALTGGEGLVVLPGAHTKWVWLDGGRIGEFFTSMSGEIFDRLTAQGLLASIADGEAQDGEAFLEGVTAGRERRQSLGTLLFGARARVMVGRLARSDAASYLRGLLIGSELGDAASLYPRLGARPIPLVGNAALSNLYASALAALGVETEIVDARRACLAGFRALHEAGR
jgi:2-dehydro-3-deoxygalactonokinase